MRRLSVCFFGLLLALWLAVPAQAALEYKLLYDATEVFDRDICWEIGAEKLTALSDSYKTQIRLDIVTDTEGYTVDEYAEMFCLGYGYGYGDTRDCILLMLCMTAQEDGGVALVDAGVYCGGENKQDLEGFLTLVEPHLGSCLTEEYWQGDLAADTLALQNLAEAYMQCAEGFLKGELKPIYPEEITKQGAYITDDSDLLTDEDWVSLEEQAKAVSLAHNVGIYIAIVENFTDDGSKTVDEAAQNRCNARHPGKDGILLLISMDGGDYAIYPSGSGSLWFDEMQIGSLCDILLEKFALGRPAKGLEEYIRHCGHVLSGEAALPEVTQPQPAPEETGSSKSFTFLILAACAVLLLLILREQFYKKERQE